MADYRQAQDLRLALVKGALGNANKGRGSGHDWTQMRDERGYTGNPSNHIERRMKCGMSRDFGMTLARSI
jgi:hypothetical protein